MKKSFLIPILTLLLLSVTSMASAQWVTTQLTNDSKEDSHPQINASGHVVWWGHAGPNREIFYYDGNTVTQLTSYSGYDNSPQINASGHVVWVNFIFRDYDDLEYKIFYYDGNTFTQLSFSTNPASHPQINETGQVVWTSHDNNDYEISYYDGNTVTRLTSNSEDDYPPQINASGHVVWHAKGDDGYHSDIFYYDGTTITQLPSDSSYDRYPKINDNGHVVWYGDDDSSVQQIYYYDGSIVTQLTNNSYDDYNPQINDSGHVVWYGYDGTDIEIFYYDGSTVTQLTNNSYDDGQPQINASGYVVWRGEKGLYGDSDFEIFIAELIEDVDSDGAGYLIDNCPYIFNPGQEDTDEDGMGDLCDVCPNDLLNDIDEDGLCHSADVCPNDPLNDDDEDGLCHSVDNCPGINNPGQEDADEDGIGDVCDVCPAIYNPGQEDYDEDGIGDACEFAVCRIEWVSSSGEVSSVPTAETSRTEQATSEAFEAIFGFGPGFCTANPTFELICGSQFLCQASDEDGSVYQVCISGSYGSFMFGPPGGTWDVFCDSDGDKIDNPEDNCPGICNVEQRDADEDGIGDVCDESPGCGGCGQDACELSCDTDTDGDGIWDVIDNCPVDANPDQLDTDSDTIGNVCDTCTNNDITAPEIVYGPVRITIDGQIYPEDIYGCTYDCSFSRDTAADGFTPVRTGYVPLSFRINDDMLETASEYVPEVSYIFTECDEDGTALPGALPIVKYGPTSLSSDSNGDFTSYVYRLEDDIDGDGESDLSKYYQFKFTVTDCVGQTSETPADGGVYYIQLVPELP